MVNSRRSTITIAVAKERFSLSFSPISGGNLKVPFVRTFAAVIVR
jgi:hypothetical protein